MKKCTDCGQLHQRSSKRCRTCVDKENTRQKEQYQERLANGLCPRCGGQPMDGGKHCDKCTARVREKDHKVRSSRCIKGMCVHCGQNPPDDGLKTCSRCLTKLKTNNYERINRLNKLGLCVRCGQFSQLLGKTRNGELHTTCQRCYLKHVSSSNLGTRNYATALFAKLKAQNYKCPYTGDDLILGDNAWIDHIMPRSRFPELAQDINNVEWVTETVNRMKQDRTPDEFLTLIKQIHSYRCL